MTFEKWWQANRERFLSQNRIEHRVTWKAAQTAAAERLQQELASIAALLPDTWYADCDLAFRVVKLVKGHRKLLAANQELERERDELRAALTRHSTPNS